MGRPGCLRDDSNDFASDVVELDFRAERHAVEAVRGELVTQLTTQHWHLAKGSDRYFTRRDGDLTQWASIESYDRRLGLYLNDGDTPA